MGEGFKKLKRKYLLSAIIKSAVCGLSFGLFVVGVLLLAFKLAGIPFAAAYYVLIAVAVTALCAAVSFLIFRPNDKKIAVEVDNQYALEEKVQSALAFKDDGGAIVEMLQSDTEEKLSSLPKSKFSFAKVWRLFAAGALSFAMIISALIVPSNVVEGEGGNGGGGGEAEDPPYVFSDEQMDNLQLLIDDVKASPLAANLKAVTVESLSKLMNNLMFADFTSEMVIYVNGTISEVEATLKEPLSFKAIANALGKGVQDALGKKHGQNALAKMIADGAQIYRDYKLEDLEEVKAFYSASVSEVTLQLKSDLSDYLTPLEEYEEKTPEEENPDEGESGTKSAGTARDASVNEGSGESDGDGTADGDGEEGEETEDLNIVQIAKQDAVTALGISGASEDDALYTALYNFAAGIAKEGDRLTNNTSLTFDVEFNDALAHQAELLAVNKFVTNGIRRIFGMEIPADELFKPTLAEESEEDKNNPGNASGGYGKGDMLYGSDDVVYHPALGYVKYGEILKEYYAIVDALLREGRLSEEQQAIIRAYFDILWTGVPDEANPDNGQAGAEGEEG